DFKADPVFPIHGGVPAAGRGAPVFPIHGEVPAAGRGWGQRRSNPVFPIHGEVPAEGRGWGQRRPVPTHWELLSSPFMGKYRPQAGDGARGDPSSLSPREILSSPFMGKYRPQAGDGARGDPSFPSIGKTHEPWSAGGPQSGAPSPTL